MFSQRQLGWNCFDIAVGIQRNDLVRFALANSSSLEFRQLLSPEIRHAAAIAAIEMNAAESESNYLRALLDTPTEENEKQRNPHHDKRATPYGLPLSMRKPELQKLLNDYANAFEQLRPLVSACNDALFLKGSNRLSIDGLDALPQKELEKNHFFSHFPAYEVYEKAREELLTPIEQRLIDYSLNETIYCQYIQDYYGARGWIAFHRQFAGEQATSMVDIAARMLNTIFVILQPSQGKLDEIYKTSNFSKKAIPIVFNGINHFFSYEEYQKMDTKFFEESKASVEKKLNRITEKLAAIKIAEIILAEDLISKINKLESDFHKMIQNKAKINYAQLKIQYDSIIFYLNKPAFVLKASYHGGLHKLKERFGRALLQVNLYLTKFKLLNKQELQSVYRGFSLLAKIYKERRAYNDIYRGKKYIKAGLGTFNEKKPAGQPNPIAVQSKQNIEGLIAELRAGNNNVVHKFGLRTDEIELFSVLLNLPLRMQHATNFYYPALNAGTLDSYAEIKRRDSDYKSPFSTDGNIEKLGNGGFIFFRVYVDPINSQETRYGKTTLIFDINLLRNIGWVSLHDQLKPFPSKNTWRFYWEKRLLRTAEAVVLHANTKEKSLFDGNRYHYRTDPIFNYNKGTLDTQKSFGPKIATVEVTRSFLEEIFFGKDILVGIALSVIRELRLLERCGFRQDFLTLFNQSNQTKKIELLGSLIKEFFRIEGKYPVALRLQANLAENTQQFSEYVDIEGRFRNRNFEIINPDGDGRYYVDGSVDTEASELATLVDDRKRIEDRLHITRSQRARAKDGSPQKQKWIEETEELEDELREIQEKQQQDEEIRRPLIQYFVELFEEDHGRFSKIDTQKLVVLRENFYSILEDSDIDLDEILGVSSQQLYMLSQEPFYELLEDDMVTFPELTECTLLQLENLAQYNLRKPIEERGMSISELLRLYDEDPIHLTCLTCDDLTDSILENAPDIHPIVLQYAREEDVDFEYILEQLGESEQILFRQNIGFYDDREERNECSQMEASDYFDYCEDEYSNANDSDNSEHEDFTGNDTDDSSNHFLSQFGSLSLLNKNDGQEEIQCGIDQEDPRDQINLHLPMQARLQDLSRKEQNAVQESKQAWEEHQSARPPVQASRQSLPPPHSTPDPGIRKIVGNFLRQSAPKPSGPASDTGITLTPEEIQVIMREVGIEVRNQGETAEKISHVLSAANIDKDNIRKKVNKVFKDLKLSFEPDEELHLKNGIIFNLSLKMRSVQTQSSRAKDSEGSDRSGGPPPGASGGGSSGGTGGGDSSGNNKRDPKTGCTSASLPDRSFLVNSREKKQAGEELKRVTEASHQETDLLLFSSSSALKRKGLSVQDNEDKRLVDSYFKQDISVGDTYDNGDCFFDSISQSLGGSPTYKELRELCASYIEEDAQKSERWVKSEIAKDIKTGGSTYDECRRYIRYTTLEITRCCTWGRPNIEGKMICEKLNKSLYWTEYIPHRVCQLFYTESVPKNPPKVDAGEVAIVIVEQLGESKAYFSTEKGWIKDLVTSQLKSISVLGFDPSVQDIAPESITPEGDCKYDYDVFGNYIKTAKEIIDSAKRADILEEHIVAIKYTPDRYVIKPGQAQKQALEIDFQEPDAIHLINKDNHFMPLLTAARPKQSVQPPAFPLDAPFGGESKRDIPTPSQLQTSRRAQEQLSWSPQRGLELSFGQESNQTPPQAIQKPPSAQLSPEKGINQSDPMPPPWSPKKGLKLSFGQESNQTLTDEPKVTTSTKATREKANSTTSIETGSSKRR